MSEAEPKYITPSTDVAPPVRGESNGVKAARLAAEHVSELETTLESLRHEKDLLRESYQDMRVRLETLGNEFERVRNERDYYMTQAMGMKQALNSAASVLVDAVKQIEFSPFKPKE